MLEGYLPRGFEKSCTNALIRGIKDCEYEGIKGTIERSLKLYKEEGKQLFYVANNIQEEVEHEWRNIMTKLIPKDEDNEKKQKAINNLNDFLEDIIYYKVDYYEVAKQLTKYYKVIQKTKKKPQLKAA
jgi:hypothetical protein